MLSPTRLRTFQPQTARLTRHLSTSRSNMSTPPIPTFSHVSLTRHEPSQNNVYILKLQRAPENRLDSAICQDVIRALHYVTAVIGRDRPGALVTSTDSQKFFSTGLDFDEGEKNPWSMTDGFYPMLAAMMEVPFPTVACVTGHSFGGGCPLALAHDYRVMNSQRGYWCMPPINIGITFSGIGALPRLKLRPQIARSMLLEAKRWTGKEALEDGIVDAIAPPDEMLGKAIEIAEKWAEKAKGGVYGELRHELYGEFTEKVRSISWVRRKGVQEVPTVKI